MASRAKPQISNTRTPAPAVVMHGGPPGMQGMNPMGMQSSMQGPMQGQMMVQGQGQQGWPQLYSNAYFFCSKCVEMVPPPRAIQSFFCVQNVLDIIWNICYIAFALRPPPAGYPASGFFWIVFILGVLEVISMLAGLVISFLARSELNVLL